MCRRKTTEEFIVDAKKVHGDKYDYSKVEYDKDSEKVCIICPEHGEFWVTPNNHLRGKNCPLCTHASRKYTNEEWIDLAKQKYPQNDYSISQYKDRRTKVEFICPTHGIVVQNPYLHIKNGCYKCNAESTANKQRKTHEQFVAEARLIFGDKYTYLGRYHNAKTPVKIKCNDCGNEFEMTPHQHISRKCGCSICNGGTKMKEDEFNRRLKYRCGNKFTVLDTYVNVDTPIRFKCNDCGDVRYRTPYKMLTDGVCIGCKKSLLEFKIEKILKENDIKYIFNYRNHDKLGRLSLDFYIQDYNIAIECQGGQHYQPVEYFGGEKEFEKVKNRDKRKYELCDKNGIKLLYYTDHKEIVDDGETIFKDEEELINKIKKIRESS